jgi:release factor glutamine methyltransferase
MFRGRFFSVTPDVLIPRPETEELVEMIIQEFEKKPLSILDLCTGSGCIAISLSLAFPGSNVWGTDVSSKALDIARKNATILQADVKFECSNLLKENPVYDPSVEFDIIVSNPPYIPMIDFNEVDSHVKDFEPHLALFVSGDDPFLFYRRIAAVAQERLKAGGYSYVEINRSFGNEVKAIFESAGLRDVSIFKDISGNERVVRSIKLD